jgi:hypothetical protein
MCDDGGEEAAEIFEAGRAFTQMGGDTRQATGGISPRRQQVDVDVEEPQRLGAADVVRVGAEEAVEAGGAVRRRVVVMGTDDRLRQDPPITYVGRRRSPAIAQRARSA